MLRKRRSQSLDQSSNRKKDCMAVDRLTRQRLIPMFIYILLSEPTNSSISYLSGVMVLFFLQCFGQDESSPFSLTSVNFRNLSLHKPMPPSRGRREPSGEHLQFSSLHPRQCPHLCFGSTVLPFSILFHSAFPVEPRRRCWFLFPPFQSTRDLFPPLYCTVTLILN